LFFEEVDFVDNRLRGLLFDDKKLCGAGCQEKSVDKLLFEIIQNRGHTKNSVPLAVKIEIYEVVEKSVRK